MNANDRYPPTGDFITVDGVRLHYRRAGSGPALVLIHGASGNIRDWDFGAFDAFATTNDTLAIDRPGFGHSERPEGASDPAVQAALLKSASAALGQQRPIVCGHSYGGAVALAWALLAPRDVGGLLLLSAPSHGWKGGVDRRYRMGSHPLFGPLVRRLIPRLATPERIRASIAEVFAPQTIPDGYVENLGAELALRPHTLLANAADITSLKSHLLGMIAHYDTLTMPVALLHGTADTTVYATLQSDRLAARLPHAVYTRIDGLGHMPHHHALPEVLTLLAHLNDHYTAKAS